MAYKKFTRKDVFQGSDSSFITITKSHIHFNAEFIHGARLDGFRYVIVHIDEENGKMGFEFLQEKIDDCFSLTKKKDRRISSFQISSRAILKKNKWIDQVSKLEGANRRFVPKNERGIWGIQLRPAFEIRKERKSNDLPSDIVGIYRYCRKASGEVVYIGMGSIKDRLQSPDRKEWDFDCIEYSIIKNQEDREKWEHFWLDKYKAEHDGNLPFYNEISGAGKYLDR